MTNINRNSKKSILKYKDVSGKILEISQFSNDGLKFTVYHGEVTEGISRKEYETLPLYISPASGNIYKIAKGLYEKIGNQFVFSEDPIIDKSNYIIIEQDGESAYFMTFGRDLSNRLTLTTKLQFETSVALTGRFYVDMVNEAITPEPLEPTQQYAKVLSIGEVETLEDHSIDISSENLVDNPAEEPTQQYVIRRAAS